MSVRVGKEVQEVLRGGDPHYGATRVFRQSPAKGKGFVHFEDRAQHCVGRALGAGDAEYFVFNIGDARFELAVHAAQLGFN